MGTAQDQPVSTDGSDGTVSVAEAARRLGVHADTVRRWVDGGYLAGFKTNPSMPRSSRRVLVTAVAGMLADRARSAEKQPPSE